MSAAKTVGTIRLAIQSSEQPDPAGAWGTLAKAARDPAEKARDRLPRSPFLFYAKLRKAWAAVKVSVKWKPASS